MEDEKISINSSQAKIFARVIYSDISSYIQSHQKEYEEFLLKLKGESKGED